MDITRSNGTYTLKKDGQSFTVTMEEARAFVNQFMKAGLLETIKDTAKELDGDTIDLERYPYSFDEFVDEVFTDMADDIDNGIYPDEEAVRNKIEDTASFYEMTI